MSAPMVGDDAVPLLKEEQHMAIPVIRAQRTAVQEDDRRAGAPVFVENPCPVLRCNDRCLLAEPSCGSGLSVAALASSGDAIAAGSAAQVIGSCLPALIRGEWSVSGFIAVSMVE